MANKTRQCSSIHYIEAIKLYEYTKIFLSKIFQNRIWQKLGRFDSYNEETNCFIKFWLPRNLALSLKLQTIHCLCMEIQKCKQIYIQFNIRNLAVFLSLMLACALRMRIRLFVIWKKLLAIPREWFGIDNRSL